MSKGNPNHYYSRTPFGGKVCLPPKAYFSPAKHLARLVQQPPTLTNDLLMADNDDSDDFAPPPGPPPILTLEQLRHVCRYGWLSYDLPTTLDEQLSQLSRLGSDFFNQDTEQKQRLYPASHGTESGYYHVEGEKEYLTLRRHVHPNISLETSAAQAWHAIAQVLHRILIDLSRVSDLHPSIWDSMLEGSLSYPGPQTDLNDVITLMRIFRYYPTSGVADPHTDLGLLTLCVGDGTGLEVRDTAHSWRPAARATILVGETLRKLSSGVIRAGLHRVVGNPEGRGSIVFALRPNLSGHVDLSSFGGEGVVETREFYMDIKGAKYNVNAKHELRDKQRRGKGTNNGMG